MNDATKFNTENLINVSTQNNFCAYYVLARRLINDDNFSVIFEKFNQFYQTNWYHDQLAEVVKNMHPEQAEIMLGLEELRPICEAFGYDSSIFLADTEGYSDSIETELQNQSDSRKILILFSPPQEGATLGHYSLIEPDADKVTEYNKICSPDIEHIYEINNSGGKNFIETIKNP